MRMTCRAGATRSRGWQLPKMTPCRQDLTRAAECLLFVSSGPVPARRLAQHLGVAPGQVPEIIDELARELAGRGLHVIEIAGGYSLATRPEHAELVTAFLEPDPERLSVQALETVAIIAYRQPITRPEIDEVRGVNSGGVIHTLLEKDLIRLAGRKQAPGRPFLLETTDTFLSVFGLKSLDELPQLQELVAQPPADTGADTQRRLAEEDEEAEPPSADRSAD